MTVLISTDNLKEELGMTKASELLAALDAAGETLEQFGEAVGLHYRPHWAPDVFSVTLHVSGSPYDLVCAAGPTPRAAYARACDKRSERERRLAAERAARERIEAEMAREAA